MPSRNRNPRCWLISCRVSLKRKTREELMEVWMRYQNIGRRKDAFELIGDRRPGYTTLAAKVGAWAANCAAYLFCKDRGDKQGAACYRLICQRIEEELGASAILID